MGWKVRSIVSGEREQLSIRVSAPEDSDDSRSSSPLTTEPVSELRDLLTAVANSITGLFKLSIILRNATPVDRYAKAASNGAYDSHFDIDYVWHKYPYLRRTDSTNEWLIERLGKANTRRREYLKYRETHRKRLAFVPAASKLEEISERYPDQHAPPASHIDDSARSGFKSDMSPSILASTTASAYVERIHQEDYEIQSMTSFALSLGREEEGKLSIPPRPKGSENERPFECPYCCTIQVVKGERAWRWGPLCYFLGKLTVIHQSAPYERSTTLCMHVQRLFVEIVLVSSRVVST